MPDPYLTNKALEKFIKGLDISQKNKDALISKIPGMSEEERVRLFDVLKDVYLLSVEEEIVVDRVKQYLQYLKK